MSLLNTNYLSVKFLLECGDVFTRAYKANYVIKEIKEDLSHVLSVPADILAIKKDGKVLPDCLSLTVLGIEAHGTVELNLCVTKPDLYFLHPDKVYEKCSIPDVLTVLIETENTLKEVVVEIENDSFQKPFLGGFRHQCTGIEYHHAFSQTQPCASPLLYGKKLHQHTQTNSSKNVMQNTMSDKAIQAYIINNDIFPSIYDKVLKTSRDKTDGSLKWNNIPIEKVLLIQRSWRKYKTKCQRSSKNEHDRDRYCQEKCYIDSVEKKPNLKCHKSPLSKFDFSLLYDLVERWRNKEIRRISDLKDQSAKKAEFCMLLEQEIKLLTTIEEHKMRLKREEQKRKDMELINKFSEQKVWTGLNGQIVVLDTALSQRAKQLKDLYLEIWQSNNCVQFDAFKRLQDVLQSVNSKKASNIISLLERELKLRSIGIKEDLLSILHLRAKVLFLELIKDLKKAECMKSNA